MSYRRWVAQCLAGAFKAGDLTEAQLNSRGAKTLGESPQWLAVLAKDTVKQFKHAWQSSLHAQITLFILQHSEFKLASCSPQSKLIIRYVYLGPANIPSSDSTIMQLGLPIIPTEGELIRWLNLSSNDFLWLKNVFRTGPQSQTKMNHYCYTWISKKQGQYRLIEAPKECLKRVQKRIYQEILKPLPQSGYVHGFVPGRSIVSHAQLHVGQALILKFDLQDFFPSIHYRKVYAQFSGLGYSHEVARSLAALCTHQTPRDIVKQPSPKCVDADLNLYNQRHLPQGAPTSPMLANLAARHLDKRLGSLAHKWGYRYSRYADDMVISGPRLSANAIGRFQAKVGAIVLEEGFSLNTRKNQAIKHSQRQQVTHIVVNKKINIKREEFDAFKALLFNCARFGPESQNKEGVANFKAHIKGKIAHYHVINPQKTLKLKRLFSRIEWL